MKKVITKQINEYIPLIKDYIYKSYPLHMQKPIKGGLNHPYFTSGIDYVNQVWDWGSWLASISMRSIKTKEMEECQKGIIYNFLDNMEENGSLPITVSSVPCDWTKRFKNRYKPVLAQHILEISNKYESFDWVKPLFPKVKRYIRYYEENQKDEESGLFYWLDDFAIGVDNNPTVFFRHEKTSGHIMLNCLMANEYEALSTLANKLDLSKEAKEYKEKANALKKAIQDECYDPIDGYFYSADLSLKKIDKNQWLHSNHPRFWHTLPIKITTWDGLMPLWCGAATKAQADKCIKHYKNPEGLYSKYGIRSLAKNEKMYAEFDSTNPSCWLGPVWVNANYFIYEGFKKYGYFDLARDLAIKTIYILGKGLKDNGGFYEYYDSNTGKGIRGLGMHGWNFLVLLMIDDIEKKII